MTKPTASSEKTNPPGAQVAQENKPHSQVLESVSMELAAVCELLRLANGAMVNTGHLSALLEPLSQRLSCAQDSLADQL